MWLSPIYASPLVDEGYDISDYTAIHPRYGTMEDFNRLLEEAHSRNIRVMIDLVLNHTSVLHPWFTEARSSTTHARRDWYIWHPGRKGRKPNNWLTNFGRSAWKRDEATGEYYYHSFFPEQPDLNWRNPEVKKAMFNMVKYWLAKGVDGFRLDVANMLFKEEGLTNNPAWALVSDRNVYNRNQPEVYELLRAFRRLLDRYPGRVSIGEIYVPPPGNSRLAASFMGNGQDMLHMAFDFTLIFTRWSACAFYQALSKYYRVLPGGGWPCFVFSNHDLGRAVNHYLFPIDKEKKAKLLATLLLTLRGTPFIYYGDEIGMCNRHIPRSRIRDRYGRLLYPFYTGRDKARTPMQWDNTSHAGFSPASPWLPVHRNYRQCNVASQQVQEGSVFTHYRKLLQLRRELPVLQQGTIRFLYKRQAGYLLYERTTDEKCCWIALNFSPFVRKVTGLPENEAMVVYHSSDNRRMCGRATFPLRLFPYEAVVIGKERTDRK
ncbi:MAG: DUF3459 domain-containing protein [Tannerellaceae bacterium]|nr:DUF3459 domain-containing protein [Tannerellaceae bacterium]